jgi:hypothetical protein
MKNIDVRIRMSDARLKGYEVASALKIAETSFSRMLARRELSEVEKQKIFTIIDELVR